LKETIAGVSAGLLSLVIMMTHHHHPRYHHHHHHHHHQHKTLSLDLTARHSKLNQT
jgi:hypothetical protein